MITSITRLPDFGKIELQSMNCTPIDVSWKKRQINEQCRQDRSCTNKDSNINLLSVQNHYEVDCFIVDSGKEADMTTSAKITLKMHNEYTDLFSEIGASKYDFVTGYKQGTKMYQNPPCCMEYMPQEPFRKELEALQK